MISPAFSPLGLPAYRPADLAAVWAVWPEFAPLLARLPGPDARPAPAAPAMPRVPAAGGKSVGVVVLADVLTKSGWWGTSTARAAAELRRAAADPDVSAILLAIDSPGGTVAGTADLAAEVRAARRKKPVWAQIQDLGASAAYWVASQADQVYANAPTALVGSIGTILTVYDASALAEREGVRPQVFSTGPLKGAGVPGTAVGPEQRDYFQGIVDDSQASFDAAVRSGRGLSAAELAAVKTGAVFPAARALELKLIDGIRSLDRTLEALARAK